MATQTKDGPFEAVNRPENDPDASILQKLDGIINGLKSLSQRMDALESRRQPGARKAGEQALADALRDKSFNPVEIMQKSAADDRACIDAQVRADAVYSHVGRRAPPAGPYERQKAYRARMLKELARYSADPKRATMDYNFLPEPTLKVMEDTIFGEILARADAILVDVAPDEIVRRERIDPTTGRRTFEYFGQRTFIDQMKPPIQRVVPNKDGELFNGAWQGRWGR